MIGCPAEEVHGDGETGGDASGDPDPIDPFDGDGIDPPGDPSPSETWRSPVTLGNGLVHDSRYDLGAGEFKRNFSAPELIAGVDWAEFVDSHAQKVRRGFRPTHVGANVSMQQIDEDATFDLSITDRSVYLCDDDANYRTTTKTHVFGSVAQEQSIAQSGPASPGAPRPTSIDTFGLPQGRVGDTIVWTYDNSELPWKLIVGQDQPIFDATVTSLAQDDYRPISVASRHRNGKHEYSAIFVRDGVPSGDWKLSRGEDAMTLATQFEALWNDGYYPFRGSYEQGSESWPRFNVLWIKSSPGLQLELRFNLDETLFEGEDAAWRRRGYHLEGAVEYSDAGHTRYAGLWTRHDPYLRWTEGIPIDTQGQTYKDRYQPFHDQAILAITRKGTPDEGEFFRPSATLHVYEGQDLVFNRAYTYAAAIYPDTPLDAPMGTASVSKSITAAAVVRELDLKGIPLTAPFAITAGITEVDEMKTVPSVADVLRNLGGFNQTPASYMDHSEIDASSYGTYPISGEEMYDYVLWDSGGHLAVMADSYWNKSTYAASWMNPANPKLTYSNPGFSMLGELVRAQSGLSYEHYVRDNFLDPLNLEQKIRADPGHRNAIDGPTRAGRRSYLINDAHAYNSIGCDDNNDCTYLACDADDPMCVTPTCSVNGTCLGCTTNGTACEVGWTCDADECINPIVPLTGSESAPGPKSGSDNSPRWGENAGPVSTSAPATSAWFRYAGRAYMGGAPLAAGGWQADGRSLGLLMYALAQTGYLMPKSVAAQLWDPKWWNSNHNKGSNWYYGLGWYVRGNWVAWAGGSDGMMSLVLHNRAYDFTVVYLANVIGNAFGDFLNPLLATQQGVWSAPGSPQSVLGGVFPCIDDTTTAQDECSGFPGPY